MDSLSAIWDLMEICDTPKINDNKVSDYMVEPQDGLAQFNLHKKKKITERPYPLDS